VNGADEPFPSADPSTGQLISLLSEQASRLARDELRLAQVELKDSVRHAGLGAGLFTATGVLGMYGLAALTATVIIVLDLVLPLWAAGLIVTVLLFVAAGIAALVGRKQVREASPTPERTMASVKRDVREVRERSHDHAS
jgi:uncharacterized membrane protein YqjE